jgi:hypothetical protein
MDIAAGRTDDAETLIFVNYRSGDAQTAAAFLHAVLSNRFGAESVFLDYENLPYGRDFEPELLDRVRSCAVLLVVIGNRWLDGEIGQRPIDDPDDWVRREIREALEHDIPIVPVLVEGVEAIPDRLPTELSFLTNRKYFVVRHRSHRMGIPALGDYLARQIPGLRDRPALMARRKWRTPVRALSIVVLSATALGLTTTFAIPAEQDESCGRLQLADGPILDKYKKERASAGSTLGCPLGLVTPTADDSGEFAVFETTGTRYTAWIYWSQGTGAHLVFGEIGKKWQALDSQAGPLGFPTGDEQISRDGVGRFQKFQGGSLYWHPTRSQGVQPISGEFLAAWRKTDYEMGALGYPVSGVLPSSDGVGRYQDFTGGTIIGHTTRSKGTHAVMGMIYLRWERHGAETGDYGYPVADEVKEGRAYRLVFERGDIVWDDAIQNYR